MNDVISSYLALVMQQIAKYIPLKVYLQNIKYNELMIIVLAQGLVFLQFFLSSTKICC